MSEGLGPRSHGPAPVPQQAHIPNSIMAILEASGKQEPEPKEAPTGPLEEVRTHSPGTQVSHGLPALFSIYLEVQPYPHIL